MCWQQSCFSQNAMFEQLQNLLTDGELVRAVETVGAVEVVNNSDDTFNAVLISNCDANANGLGRLPDGAEIAQDQSATLTISADFWDVIGSSAGVADARKHMNVSAGGTIRHTIGPSE